MRIGKKGEIHLLRTFPFKVHAKAGPKWYLMYIVARKLNIIYRGKYDFANYFVVEGIVRLLLSILAQVIGYDGGLYSYLFDSTCILSNQVVSLLKKLVGLINSMEGE